MGVEACGVVCADEAGESSYNFQNILISPSSLHSPKYLLQMSRLGNGGATYPHKTSRTPRENPISIHNLCLPPACRPRASTPTPTSTSTSTSGRRAFDVIVESFYNVTCACFFEVGGFVAVDLVFELGLRRVGISEGAWTSGSII